MTEIEQVVPHLSRPTIKRMLDELRAEGKAVLRGARRWARWYATGPHNPGKGRSRYGSTKSGNEP